MRLNTIAKNPFIHHTAMAAGAYVIGSKLLKDGLLARNVSIATIGVCLLQQLILKSDADFEKQFTACSFVSLAAFGFIAYKQATTPTTLLCLGLYILNLHSLSINNSYTAPQWHSDDYGIWYWSDILVQNRKMLDHKTLINIINLIPMLTFAGLSKLLIESKIGQPFVLPFYALGKQLTTPLRIVQSFILNASKPPII